MFSIKNKSLTKGKMKRDNLKRETRGPVFRQVWGGVLRARTVPDACMQTSMGFRIVVWVMFGVVVSPDFGACLPVILKLFLRNATTELPEAHILHIAPAWNNFFIGKPCGSRVICLDRASWLGPTHVNGGLVVRNHFSCRDEESRSF
jgi:hypothetical protein